MSSKSTWMSFVFAIYLGLVCLISGVVTAVSAGSILNNAVTYQFPELEVNWYEIDRTKYNHETKQETTVTETEKEERLIKEVERVELRSLRNMLDSGTYLFIAFFIFIFHWRLFKKERAA